MAYKSFFPKSDDALLSDISQNTEEISNNIQRSNSEIDFKISDIKSFIANKFNELEKRISATDEMINGYMDKMNEKMKNIPNGNNFNATKLQAPVYDEDYYMDNRNQNRDFDNLNEKESKSVVKRMVGVLKRAGFKIQEKADEHGGYKEMMKKIMYNIGGFFAHLYTAKTGLEAATENLPGWLRTIIYYVYNGSINTMSSLLTFTTSPILRFISSVAGAPWTDSDQNKLDSLVDILKLDTNFNGGSKTIEFGVDIAKRVIEAIKNSPIIGGIETINKGIKSIYELIKWITPDGIKDSISSTFESVKSWFSKDNKDKELAEETKVENDIKAESQNIDNNQQESQKMTISQNDIESENNDNNVKVETDIKNDIKDLKPTPVPDIKNDEDEKDNSSKTNDKLDELSVKIDDLSGKLVTVGQSIINQNGASAEALMNGIQKSSNGAFNNNINTREGQ